jgi:hypothetical protein
VGLVWTPPLKPAIPRPIPLPADNSASLAEALRSIMLARRDQENFQLVVITHDEQVSRPPTIGACMFGMSACLHFHALFAAGLPSPSPISSRPCPHPCRCHPLALWVTVCTADWHP